MYHIPALLTETIDGLNIKPDGTYVDVTFGGGGHSRAILAKLGDKGRLIAFDQGGRRSCRGQGRQGHGGRGRQV